jgi:hypothetical protein
VINECIQNVLCMVRQTSLSRKPLLYERIEITLGSFDTIVFRCRLCVVFSPQPQVNSIIIHYTPWGGQEENKAAVSLARYSRSVRFGVCSCRILS